MRTITKIIVGTLFGISLLFIFFYALSLVTSDNSEKEESLQNVESESLFPDGVVEKIEIGSEIEQQEKLIQAKFGLLLGEFPTTSDDPYSYIQSRNVAIVETLTKHHEQFTDSREADCKRYELYSYGGTAASSTYLVCIQEINQEYIEDLEYFRETLVFESDNDDLESEAEMDIMVTMLGHRTYGRVFLQDMSPTSSSLFLLAEPWDVISDGGSRYSLMTNEMREGGQYIVTGKITEPCFDKVEGSNEELVCVAWFELVSVAEVSNL